jgi:aspartate kinase
MIVIKFGGSSLATAKKIRRCIGLVKKEIDRKPVVVVSAHGKTTSRLVEAANRACSGKVAIDEIERVHYDLVTNLGLERVLIETLIYKLSAFLHGVSLLGELTPRTLDQIMSFGERLSTRIIASAMEAEGVPAAAVNSFEIGLNTDSRHGDATPLPGIDEGIKKALSEYKLVPIVTGFLGRSENEHITTLGRSGSDFSASIIGAAIEAEEIQIWTDVSGVMTCDPSVEPAAMSLPQLSFDEASELAYYGAKVLHPSTLVPAIRKGIPIRVLNTIKPEDQGTVVLAESKRGDRIAKSIVYKEDVCLINLSSPRLMSAVKILSNAFEILSNHGIGIHMATTSEATVSLVTDKHYEGRQLENALGKMGTLGEVEVETKKAIICVVGEELKGSVGVLGQIFGAISNRGIKAKMVSQSASEINVAFLVDNAEIEPAVCALHALLVGEATRGDSIWTESRI